LGWGVVLTAAVGADAVTRASAAYKGRRISHPEWAEAGGERLELMTVTQNSSVVACNLYRMPKGQRAEPLGCYDSQQAGRDALYQWVRYVNDGGTVEEWRLHNKAQAWTAWHQEWLHQIREHAVEVLGWLGDHPGQEQYANEQMKQAIYDLDGGGDARGSR
jgi:hypothetical protein